MYSFSNNPSLQAVILNFQFTLLLIIRCDADPAALAKYVLALIKKDKPVEELKVEYFHFCIIFSSILSAGLNDPTNGCIFAIRDKQFCGDAFQSCRN